jgi:class 3 adenylate cyclase
MTEKTAEEIVSPLQEIEARLQGLLPAKLYAEAWINPNAKNLTRVFNHLRTLHRILYDYLPRQLHYSMPKPGKMNFSWEEGTLMFTDLSGFTPLLEGNARLGRAGAESLQNMLNSYFTEMIQIISKASGNLLEFTGDALLIQFSDAQRQKDTTRAVRAALRMQRAMKQFSTIMIGDEKYSLGMRIGLHVGRFLIADIGTPRRMEHVLLGSAVLRAKQAEGAGMVGRVSLTKEAQNRIKDEFRFEPTKDKKHVLVVDNLTDEQLGDYDIVLASHRLPRVVLSIEGLAFDISNAIQKVEPLASFIPNRVLNLLVENAAERHLPPDFPLATIMFVNLLGLPETLQDATEDQTNEIIATFSRLVSLINAEIEAQGGVMKKVTYHHAGPDIMIIFGVPDAHTNDSARVAQAALSIREIVREQPPVKMGDEESRITSHIGITRGQVFAAEVGDVQGRREFNTLGNTVNTAARLMDHAESDQIVLSKEVWEEIKDEFVVTDLGDVKLKGRSEAIPLYQLEANRE